MRNVWPGCPGWPPVGRLLGGRRLLGFGLQRPSEDGGLLLLFEFLAAFSSSAWTFSRKDWQSRRRAAFSAFSVATSTFNWSSSRENSQSNRAAVSGSVRQTVSACS